MKLVESAHNKAFKEIDASSTAKKQYNTLKGEINLTKEKLKETTDELKHQEKLAEIEHAQVIDMEEKCRKLTQLLREHNQGNSAHEPAPAINENEVEKLQRDLETLDNQLKEDQYKYDKLHKKMLADIHEATKENEVLKFQLKTKEHEIKIDGMKIKELKRSIPKTMLKSKATLASAKKGVLTQYPNSISSGKKAFNTTGKFHKFH